MLKSDALVIFTQQIGHYHAARFEATRAVFNDISIASVMNAAHFKEFLSSDTIDMNTMRLFSGRDSYMAAVRSGEVQTEVFAVLDALKPRVVAVAGWAFPESVSAIMWAHANGAKVIMMSDSQERDATRRSLREAIKSRVVKACHAALVGGRYQSEYIVSLGMPRERIFLGYNAIDNRHFSDGADRARMDAVSVRRRHGLPERYLLVSARFIPKKNLENLVKAFARALELAPTSHHLVILGDGPGRPALQTAIASAGLGERVLLPGFQEYDNLPAFYGLADALVHVSLAEQWGLVINEAAAASLPLIVSDVCGAAPELVQHGDNGFLVNPNDIEGMAHALRQMMIMDEARRETMGATSRKIVANWGTERFANGLREASRAAIEAPHHRLPLSARLIMRLMTRRYISDVS